MKAGLTFEGRVEPAGSVVPLLDATGRKIGTVSVVDGKATATVTDEVFAETLRVARVLRVRASVLASSIGEPAAIMAELVRRRADVAPTSSREESCTGCGKVALLNQPWVCGDCERLGVVPIVGSDLAYEPMVSASIRQPRRQPRPNRVVPADALIGEVEGATTSPAARDGSNRPPSETHAWCSDMRGHQFCDADGKRVYLYCQRGCGMRDPEEPTGREVAR